MIKSLSILIKWNKTLWSNRQTEIIKVIMFILTNVIGIVIPWISIIVHPTLFIFSKQQRKWHWHLLVGVVYWLWRNTLTHFKLMFHFCSPWKRFMEMEQWLEWFNKYYRSIMSKYSVTGWIQDFDNILYMPTQQTNINFYQISITYNTWLLHNIMKKISNFSLMSS